MLQLARTPRWLAALAVLVLFVVAAVVAGRWQWQRTQDILAAERAAAAQALPIEQLVQVGAELPAAAMGHPVTLAGAYDPALQSAIPSRTHHGAPGVWIVTGLRLETGSVVAVLRGSLPNADAPGAVPPAGPVVVTGVVQPDESFYADSAALTSIVNDRLAKAWGTTLLPGFVTLQSQDPQASPAPSPVQPTMTTDNVAFPLQNFFYAFQWWIFAVFAIALYGRWLWVESRPKDPDAAAA
jgi:cytochrome oxidase assembly protein ShyY1